MPGRETGSDTGRGSGTGKEAGSGSGSGRDTGRESKAGLNIDTDSRMRGESSSTPRGHLESKSSDGSKSDLMQWKGTVEPAKIGVWDGVNKVPSQGQGEAPSWARNREGDRNRAEDDDEEDRTCLSGRTADQPKAVTAVAGKKAIPQRSHLSDAQKDSIIRQIRAASAGRVRRPVLRDPLNTEDEYAHDDEGREGDADRNPAVTEHTAEDRSVVRSQVQQGVLSRGQEQHQKLETGMHSISSISHDPRDVDKNMISSVQQLQRNSDVDISHKPSSLSSYFHTSSDGTYPRERAPEDDDVVALQNYSSNVKPDAILESGSRIHRNNEVLKNNIAEGIQEEKEQDRGSSRESKKKGSFIECGGLVEEDEVKRLAKFEKMKEKKIAEAQARLLVRYLIS